MAEQAARKTAPRRKRAPATQPRTQPQPVRGLLPTVDPATAGALRDFYRVPRWWLLGDGTAIQALPSVAPASAFALDAEGARLALHVEGPASAGSDDARLRWSDLTGRARVLAWSLAHEATLRRLSDWLGASLLPLPDADREGTPDGDDVPMAWFEVRLEDEPVGDGPDAPPPTVTTARLRMPIAWLQPLALRAEPPHEDDPAPGSGRWRTLAEPVLLLLPVPLAMADWCALRPGDVVVVGHRGMAPACVARAAGRDWPLSPAPGGWAARDRPVPAPEFTKEPAMTGDEETGSPAADAPDAAEAAAPVGDPARALPVRIEFELGRTEMTIGELADLQPGYVFPLATALEGSNVAIRANGRVAGRGELVAVGDTLGVRLLSWS